jgi:RimJ/RimL family protein N-acetyltransferase
VPFHLKELSPSDEELLTVLHHWNEAETQREMYTCRPITPLKSLEEYIETTKLRLEQRTTRIFVLVSDNEKLPYGKVTAFDHNPRNQSAEFGYYLPQINRGKGYGKILVQKFLKEMFQDTEWKLNKLYATTASGNAPSTRLLQSLGFHLDGTIREHYWIANQIQDQLHYSLLKREYA